MTPPPDKIVPVTALLPESLVARIREVADGNERSMAAEMRLALREAFPEKPKTRTRKNVA